MTTDSNIDDMSPTGRSDFTPRPRREPMLLIHLDINKTIIQSDSIQMKSIEEGIREGIAELFWGTLRKDESGKVVGWDWCKNRPSCSPPELTDCHPDDLYTYLSFCKKMHSEKDQQKLSIRTFRLVEDEEAKGEMIKVLDLAMKKLQLPSEVRFSPEAESVGLKGSTIMMFPAVFHLVAALQRAKRKFAILFRSFGVDHENIKQEWNAFCEMRHPLYSRFLEGIGPLDGTAEHLPDRRIDAMHTLYRDAEGPLLVIDHLVEAQKSKDWDRWARDRKNQEDTRDGRNYILRVLKDDQGARVADGLDEVREWMLEHIESESTSAIKDDWAWWAWKDEDSSAGKLLTVFPDDEIKQVFFDDNVHHSDPRIIDCRYPDGSQVAPMDSIDKLCCKVNSVEAIIDDEYFLRKLQICHGGNLLINSSLIDFQYQITEAEEQKAVLQKEIKALQLQVKSITEENSRMKILHRVEVQNEVQLRDFLTQHNCPLDSFGIDGFRKLSDLYGELEQGLCCLELDIDKKPVRILEMLFLKVLYKDLVLIESHEQYSDGRIMSRNFLPGVVKGLKESSFQEAISKFFEAGLEVNLSKCILEEAAPAFNPEAQTQRTLATEAYPIPCKVQQFEATFTITDPKNFQSIDPKEFQQQKDILAKIGLPTGKNFTTERKEMSGGKITHFWRWDKLAAWEATALNPALRGDPMGGVNVADVVEKVFGGHPYREVYENLLLQMFETFVAKKLCGGFSGSMVIRVQPFEKDGRPGEPCIVKLDRADAIREEHVNSIQVFEALPDRAARIIGDAAYANSEQDGEFGAMRLELAGACWNVPELATGSSNLLSTFKDLLLYESELMMLGALQNERNDARPFGSVNSVLAETFGPGGMVSSLRKGGQNGVFRATEQLPWGWYTLKGKDTDFNPYGKMKDTCTGQVMRQMYERHFHSEMPNLKELVVDQIKPRLERLAKRKMPGLCPLVGLAHGDLNAANIMIDALDAVWLIDFATSVDLPLLTDLCKFEMACLFEYAILPITVENLYDLSGPDEEHWEKMGIGEWLGVQQDVATSFLKLLQQRVKREKLASLEPGQLEMLVDEAIQRLPLHKQPQARRAILSRLTASQPSRSAQAKTDCAFRYCESISKAMLGGDGLLETLRAEAPRIEGADKFTGCGSLRFFVDIAKSIRRFMLREIQMCFRDFIIGTEDRGSGELQVCDALSLQMWLPFLRESYRIVGYRDIPPQKKLWSIYHCKLVADNVLRTLEMLDSMDDLSPGRLEGLKVEELTDQSLRLCGLYKKLKDEIINMNFRRSESVEVGTFTSEAERKKEPFTEADSRWIHSHGELFSNDGRHCRIVQSVHAECEVYCERPGLFAPIFQVVGPKGQKANLHFGEDQAPQTWRLCLKKRKSRKESMLEESDTGRLSDPWEDLDRELLGDVSAERTPLDPPEVRLASRLIFLPHSFLVNELRKAKHKVSLQGRSTTFRREESEGAEDAATEMAGSDCKKFDHSFSLQNWFPQPSRLQHNTTLSSATVEPNSRRGTLFPTKPGAGDGRPERQRFSTMTSSGRLDNMLTVPDSFPKFLTLQAVAVDEDGNEKMQLELWLGMPVCCYPAGARICLGRVGERQEGIEEEFIINSNKPTGNYMLHKVTEDDGDGAHDPWHGTLGQLASYSHFKDQTNDFTLKCNNHIYLAPCKIKAGDRVVLLEQNQWVNANVNQTPQATEFRFDLTLERERNDEAAALHRAPEEEDAEASICLSRQEDDGRVQRYLSPLICCQALLSAANFEEELSKMKAFYRARHSSIIDALSGTRLDVRTCTIPQLHVMQFGQVLPQPALETQRSAPSASSMAVPASGTSSLTVRRHVTTKLGSSRDLNSSKIRVASKHGHEELAGGSEQKTSWNLIVNALERYNKATSSCGPNAFWVIGAPGSGKNCLMCRVIMDSVSRFDNLVPLRLPIIDLVKRTDQMPERDQSSVQTWFDKYMRILFGEDTPRYKMMKMAIAMRRALLLFEGLDAAGTVSEAVRLLIQGFVKDGHFVLMTSRPLPPNTMNLEGIAEHLVVMEMQFLTDEQKRAIANQRLGPQGLQSFNAFIRKIRGERGDEATGAPEDRSEDVFGNPMMLSMLLCYLSPKAENEVPERKRSSTTEDDSPVDLMAVYRVSVSVMLKRMLLQQQADRHIPEGQLVQCSRVLERAAMNMQAKKTMEIDCDDFEKELSTELKSCWQTLRQAVEVGRAMLLRMHREGTRTYIRFMIKGFQDYFSACAISNSNDMDHLPNYRALLTDTWWAQMLDMLAQAWPKKYVQLMERKIEDFKDPDGSYLHLAAKEGHLPIFRLVRLFSDSNQVQLRQPRAKDLMTPLHVAAQHGHRLVCETIMDQKAPVDTEDCEERLPLHLALQHGHFQLARVLLDRLEQVQASYGGRESRQRKKNLVETLACRMLAKNELQEDEFKAEVEKIFLEMRYFRKEEQNENVRQMAALLSVYWVISEQYETFTQGQAEKDKLHPESWKHMLQWVNDVVCLTPERVAAVLVYCAIFAIGKISPFQREFAPEATEPIGALASIVQRHPVLVPSFQRLDEEEQNLIVYCLKAQQHFNFGQFLQAESLPMSLAKCKELLICPQETLLHDVFSFFLFTVFMSLCAILGVKSLNGSLFMTEDMYNNNFKVGLEALNTLKEKEALTVYDGFLQKRAELAQVEFDGKCSSKDQQKAIVRLICLTRIFEKEKGKRVYEEFMSLEPDVRQELTEFLNADGLTERGFLLFHSPTFMFNAFDNEALSPAKAMRLLLKMYQLANEAFPITGDGAGVITVMVEEVANYAKKCTDPEVFDSTNLEIKRFHGTDRTAKIVLSPWQIDTNPDDLDKEVEALFTEVSMQGCSEQSFQARLKICFPEFKYMEDENSDEVVAEIKKRSICTMLCIYWLYADRYMEFTRGQQVSQRLTEDSWSFLRSSLQPMLDDLEVLSVVCAAVMVRAVCSLPKFRQQQAKGISEPRDVVAHVLKHCPKVLPSYQRLNPEERQQLAESLGHDFELHLFLDAESCPAGLRFLQPLVKQTETPEATRRTCDFDPVAVLMWASLLELAGSMGAESQEGSLFLTEERCQKIRIATESIQQMAQPSVSEVDVYDQILERRAKAVQLHLDDSLFSKALKRLSCLAASRDNADAENVRQALNALSDEDRGRMVKYLTNGGSHAPEDAEPPEKTCFAMLQATAFLEKARDNKEIGLAQATRTLLRVYDEAQREFQQVEVPMVKIRLDKLARFAADFMGSAQFEDVPFELKRISDLEVEVIPKVWIPVINQEVLDDLNQNSFKLCSELREHRLSERIFRDRLFHIYPELGYFAAGDGAAEKTGAPSDGPAASTLRDQSVCALCCVFWLLMNQRDSFIRGQAQDQELSRQSWAWIQDWLQKSVKLNTPEAIDAALSFMAIHALGKYKAFREDRASGQKHTQEMHDLALAQILQERPEVVPSVNRLDKKYKSLIIDCLSVDFEFSQFLLGENTVANLALVKEKLKPHGPQGHAFFLFRIFAQMCGKSGQQSQLGSLFMNETMFKRCTPGLKALQNLWTSEGADCWADFMLLRGSKAMSRFASPEHEALSRLLCLFDAFDKEEGSVLCNAFDQLDDNERAGLTKWLNSTGDYVVVIPNASRMLQNAKKNVAVGLVNALKIMLKVREECRRHEEGTHAHRVVVQFADLASWAQDYHGEFPAEVSLRSTLDVQGDTKVITLEVEPSSISIAPSCAAPTGSRPQELSEPSRPSSPVLPASPSASPARRRNDLMDSTTQTPQRSEGSGAQLLAPVIAAAPGPTRPRSFCLGRYTLVAISFIWAVIAACMGDAELTLGWRNLLFSVLIMALMLLALYVQCNNLEIPLETASEVNRSSNAEPFLAQWGVMHTSSREPQYSRLQTCDDEVP